MIPLMSIICNYLRLMNFYRNLGSAAIREVFMQVAKQDQVYEKIIIIHDQKIIIDADVAELYGVETKRVNEAVKNNPEKFSSGYLLEISNREKNKLVENFDRFKKLKHSSVPLKGFTEKGLYMLATILKSPKAVETTLAYRFDHS